MVIGTGSIPVNPTGGAASRCDGGPPHRLVTFPGADETHAADARGSERRSGTPARAGTCSDPRSVDRVDDPPVTMSLPTR